MDRAGIYLGWLLCMGSQSALAAEPWRLVEDESWLVVRLVPKRSGLLSGVVHEHLIRARRFTGELSWDGESCALRLEIPVKDLEVDPPDGRRRFSMKDAPDADDRAKIGEHMRAEDQLDQAKHPSIRFVADSCTKKVDSVLVRGRLEVRGKSRAIEVPVKITEQAERITAKGSFGLLHSDFGFEPYSTAFGAIANGEALRFDIELVAKR